MGVRGGEVTQFCLPQVSSNRVILQAKYSRDPRNPTALPQDKQTSRHLGNERVHQISLWPKLFKGEEVPGGLKGQPLTAPCSPS